MSNNLYWSVYQNLEKELIELTNHIHVDDKQINVYYSPFTINKPQDLISPTAKAPYSVTTRIRLYHYPIDPLHPNT